MTHSGHGLRSGTTVSMAPENRTEDPEHLPESQHDSDSEEDAELSSRRSFLTRNFKRAVYVAPIIWSVSARQALAATNVSGLSGPPDPE